MIGEFVTEEALPGLLPGRNVFVPYRRDWKSFLPGSNGMAIKICETKPDSAQTTERDR